MSKLPLSENSHFGWLYSFIRSFSRIICFSNIFCPHLEASRTCSFSTSFFASCLLRVSFLRLLLEQYLFWSCLNLDNVRICNKRLCWLTLKRLILQLDFYYANSPGKGCFFFISEREMYVGCVDFFKKKCNYLIFHFTSKSFPCPRRRHSLSSCLWFQHRLYFKKSKKKMEYST